MHPLSSFIIHSVESNCQRGIRADFSFCSGLVSSVPVLFLRKHQSVRNHSFASHVYFSVLFGTCLVMCAPHHKHTNIRKAFCEVRREGYIDPCDKTMYANSHRTAFLCTNVFCLLRSLRIFCLFVLVVKYVVLFWHFRSVCVCTGETETPSNVHSIMLNIP